MRKKSKNKMEFSKKLILQESILLWIVTIAFIALAFLCVINGYFGELPWLATMAACPWTAYGVGQGFYYKKAEKENTKGGIKYDSIIKECQTNDDQPPIPEEQLTDSAVG